MRVCYTLLTFIFFATITTPPSYPRSFKWFRKIAQIKRGRKKPRKYLFRSIQDNFYEVERDTFYRSKQLYHKKLAHYLKKFGIKTVINLRGRNEHAKWWRREKETVERHGATLYDIRMSARRFPYKDDLLFLLSLFDYAERPILVHCNGGADRAGEAAALWVLEKQKKRRKDALKQLSLKYGHIKQKTPLKRRFIKLWAERDIFKLKQQA